MNTQASPRPEFAGFPDFRANVTFVPIQFFTVVLPQGSRGTVRIVGYALRKLLGWVDAHGNPTRERLRLSYRELVEQAGVSREAIADALREAIDKHLLRCVQWPRSDTAGRAAQNGVYELCWDEHGPYTDAPASFRGFYYPEAAVVPVQEAGGLVHRPKAARKNIPNVFFDTLLPRERLSVIRVVGAMLFYAIQWGPGGERKVPVSLSITELSRLTRLSRQHVHGAVTEACERGYIERTQAGVFDRAAGRGSRAASYAIRWTAEALAERVPCARAVGSGRDGHRSEKGYGRPVRKGERKESEMVNGERSEKVNGISIKTELKIDLTTAGPAAAAGECPTVRLLQGAGFDAATATRLAARHTREVIQRQVDWLPLRHSTRSRLGLLRRAIEQDWPRPQGLAPDDEARLKLARTFARHYYAAYHGNEGATTVEPFPKDLEAAAQFLERLADSGTALAADEQGRQVGQWMRDQHRNDPRAKPNLSFALVLHAEAFLCLQKRAKALRTRSRLDQTRIAYQRANLAAYCAYLREAETDVQRTQPELHRRFTEERARVRRAMTGGLLLASADTLAKFEREESRLLALAEFCRNQPNPPVLGFWQWDAWRKAENEVSAGAEHNAVRNELLPATEVMERRVVDVVVARPASA